MRNVLGIQPVYHNVTSLDGTNRYGVDPRKGEMVKKKLSRCIGAATNVSSLMVFWYLLPSYRSISRRTAASSTAEELA